MKIILFTLLFTMQALAGVNNPISFQPVSIVSATGTITTTSGSDVLMTGMTLTPPAGVYHAQCDTTLTNDSNNSQVFVSIYVGGTQIASSEKSAKPRVQAGFGSALNLDVPITSVGEATVNGSQAIECRWSRSGGNANSINGRSLKLERIR